MRYFLASFISFLVATLASPVNSQEGTYKSSKHADPVIGVYRDSVLPRGNCSQCHIQHGSDTRFDFGLFAPADNSTCLSSGCHEYEYQWPSGDYHWSFPGNSPDWYNSAHGLSASQYPQINGRQVSLCVQCHDSHAQGDSINGVYASSTRPMEEHGCYSNGVVTGQGCHGMNAANRPVGADDIYSQIIKSTRHNIANSVKVHSSDWSSIYPYGRESRQVNSGDLSGSNRHVECVDCHNPHKALSGSHQVGSNEIGGALVGAWGVEPSVTGAWMAPVSFGIIDFDNISGSYEYQLCYKCHGYFAFGNTPPAGYTDIAREFNTANLSYHPIEDTISQNSYTSPSSINGFQETMKSPWDNGMHDKMTCSDCHASENESDPRGPHGSNNPFILRESASPTENNLCVDCHNQSVYSPIGDPGSGETGSRFDAQTTGTDQASHYFHAINNVGCRQCHGARQVAPPDVPTERNPYPTDLGSIHGTNIFPGLMNGANIAAYSPGSCTPTCHSEVTYIAGSE